MTPSGPLAAFRLTNSAPVDARDEHDEKFERCFIFVQGLIENLSETEAQQKLNDTISASPHVAHEEISLGLLMLILTDHANAPRWYRDLSCVARDGQGTAAGALQVIILEKYHKLPDPVRDQVFWLFRQMIKGSVKDMENVFYNMLRIIVGGDLSPRNIRLTENVLSIAVDHRAWLERFPILIAATVYTFLRLMEDHASPLFATNIRVREAAFVVSMLREHFGECMIIGRDLVRLLINVAAIPEINALWKDLIHNPTSFAPNFTGIDQLMATRTSRRFLLLRLTPEMEKKIYFLTSSVRLGDQARYLEWFQRQYLSTPESQTLRCDLVRFICGVIHPPNEILCSNIMPRWAVIGWLITTTTSSVISATLKLSLFFDWLFYDPARDNIMNIEPAILLMFNWGRRHPARTASLLDFICRISSNFHPSITPQITRGLKTAFQQCLEKRVVPNLNPIFENAAADRSLKTLVMSIFPEYAPPSPPPSIMGTAGEHPLIVLNDSNINHSSPPVIKMDDDPTMTSINYDHNDHIIHKNAQNGGDDHGPDQDEDSLEGNERISSEEEDDTDEDDEEEEDGGRGRDKKPKMNSHGASNNNNTLSDYATMNSTATSAFSMASPSPPLDSDLNSFNFEERLDSFGDQVRTLLLKLKAETDTKSRCGLTDRLLEAVLADDDFTIETCTQLAPCLVYLLRCDLARDTYPVDPLRPRENNPPSAASLGEAISYPLYVIFRRLAVTPSNQEEDESDDPHAVLLRIVCEMANEEPRLGCLLLFFLRVVHSIPSSSLSSLLTSSSSSLAPNMPESVIQDPKRLLYKEFVKESGREISASLISDADFAQKYNPYLFFYLIPDIFTHFSSSVSGNSTLIYSIVSLSDANQLQDIVVHLLLAKYRIFKKDSLISVLTTSLEWDTIEQYWLWQLIVAQGYPVEAALPILSKLDYDSHAEALTNILMLLQREPCSASLLKAVLAREFPTGETAKKDDFVNSILKVWEWQDESQLAELLSAQLTAKTNSPHKRKRGQQSAKPATNSQVNLAAENILAHLNHFRPHAKATFFSNETLKSCIAQVYTLCSDSQKSRFSELFTLTGAIEPDESDIKTNSKSNKASSSAKNSAKNSNANANKKDSDTESDESEEDVPKVKNSKQATNRKKRKIANAGSDSD